MANAVYCTLQILKLVYKQVLKEEAVFSLLFFFTLYVYDAHSTFTTPCRNL